MTNKTGPKIGAASEKAERTIPIGHNAAVDSTNSALKRMIADGSLRTAYALSADEQTAGRGRHGRVWLNTDGALMLSACCPLAGFIPERIPLISLAAALGVLSAVRKYCPDAAIKWPNDIVTNVSGVPKKLCGILSELTQNGDGDRFCVIGIGINVNAASIPQGLMQPATSLLIETGKETPLEELGREVTDALFRRIDMLARNAEALLKDYCSQCITLGRNVRAVFADGSAIEGVARSLDGLGRLVIETNEGMITADAADVSVRPVI